MKPIVMNVIVKQLQLIKRIDQLIQLKATGSPIELASRLEVSKSKLYRILDIMKALNAPVEFDTFSRSYYYVKEVEFTCGFYEKPIGINKEKSLSKNQDTTKKYFFSQSRKMKLTEFNIALGKLKNKPNMKQKQE